MRIAYLVLVLFHGLIHVLGFVKGFGFKEVKELTLPISKPMGLVWLGTTILFVAYAIMFFINARYTWILGILAVTISQLLIFLFWKDARFGSLPNILILLVSIILLGYGHFQNLVQQETAHLLSRNQLAEEKIMRLDDISHLPQPVQHWLRSSGAVGKPMIHTGKVLQKAEMKLKPEQESWMSATAIQYTSIEHPAFIWSVDVKMNALLRFQGRDKFENGKGEMLIKLNSLLTVVNAQGEKLDEGSLQRYLGEMVWFPSLALSPYINWETINETTAKATMNYQGTTGSGTFYFNDQGEVAEFSALRYKGDEASGKRYDWIMKITGYKIFEGIKVPAVMSSIWKLEQGDWTWLKLEVTDVKYNELISH